MAIVIDQLSIGETAADSASSTVAFTTNQTVASNGFIVVTVTWINPSGQTLLSVGGGGLTWNIDKQGQTGGTEAPTAIVSAQAPSGLASGTTITATFSASVAGARSI